MAVTLAMLLRYIDSVAWYVSPSARSPITPTSTPTNSAKTIAVAIFTCTLKSLQRLRDVPATDMITPRTSGMAVSHSLD
jgi:hypothetical protein